jgi:hypothetical protein
VLRSPENSEFRPYAAAIDVARFCTKGASTISGVGAFRDQVLRQRLRALCCAVTARSL